MTTPAAALLADGPVRVLGLMRIKNEARWIGQSIESQLGICDKMLVLDDHSTDDTCAIVSSFGDRCVLAPSEFEEGTSEGRDKRFLLQHAIAVNPEWVLWIDGDEVLTKESTVIASEELSRADVVQYWLRMIYFWNDLTTIRVDGIFRDFGRPSLFRVQGQDTSRFSIPAGSGTADLHNNGNCPLGLQGVGARSRMQLKHYGYLDREHRQRKYEFYNRVDPNNESEDCYRHIMEIPGARHAPGPTVLEHWEE